jgi:hypothetical protein
MHFWKAVSDSGTMITRCGVWVSISSSQAVVYVNDWPGGKPVKTVVVLMQTVPLPKPSRWIGLEAIPSFHLQPCDPTIRFMLHVIHGTAQRSGMSAADNEDPSEVE